MADPGKKVKTLVLAFRDLPEEAFKEALLEYFQGFGEVIKFWLVSGRAEAEPFCFVRYKDKSAEDQVLGPSPTASLGAVFLLRSATPNTDFVP